MNDTAPFVHTRSPLFGALLFAAFVIAGAAYIIWANLAGFPGLMVTVIPLVLMILYALVLAAARFFRLRDDQAGDNLYYLGFLYTLTSLGVSLWQFSVNEGAEGIVTNFGIAIASTILGVALRVIFNQMRQDPIEVERTARLELADAARRVKLELDATVFEFSSYRRASQQILEQAAVESTKYIDRVIKELFDGLKDIPRHSAEPLAEASVQSKQVIERLAAALTELLDRSGGAIASQLDRVATAAQSTGQALDSLDVHLKS